MKEKVKPAVAELQKLKSKLFFGDYPKIMRKANKSGAKLTRNIMLNAFSGRLQDEKKLTAIKMATVAFIAERNANSGTGK